MDKKNIEFFIMNKDNKVAHIRYDYVNDYTYVNVFVKGEENHVRNGARLEELKFFLDSRMFPVRHNHKETLKKLGLDENASTIEILHKTEGRMFGDNLWLKF